MNDNAFSKIAHTIVRTAQTKIDEINNNLLFGTVITIEPLSIQIDNHHEALPSNFFWLGQNVRPHKITIPHTHLFNYINMGYHKHDYSGIVDANGLHQHSYADITELAGNHTHIQDLHEHEFSSSGSPYLTQKTMAINKPVDDHKHNYSGIVDINGLHQHDYADITENTIVEKDFTDTNTGTNDVTEEFVIIEIYPKLQESDRVLLFSFNNGQKYYVAEKL